MQHAYPTQPAPQYGATVREAVGVFDSVDALQMALNDLEENGFRREEISVLAREEDVRAKLSTEAPALQDIMENPATPRAVFVPQEVLREGMASMIGVPLYFGAGLGALTAIINAAQWPGILVSALAGAAIGGIIGGAASFVAHRWWRYNVQRQLNRGGLVMWVNISHPDLERRAWKVLSRNRANYVHVHEIPAA